MHIQRINLKCEYDIDLFILIQYRTLVELGTTAVLKNCE
jgi:hypothetical protein